MTTLLVQGQPAMWMEVTIPWSGIPLVRCRAPDIAEPSAGQVVFTMADMVINANLVPNRSSVFAGTWGGEAVAGFGGWKQTVGAKGYRSPAGLLNVQILADVARTVGEPPPVVQSPRSVGGFYVRGQGPASQVFSSPVIGDSNWWVSLQGIAQVGTRTPGPVTSDFSILEITRKAGRVIIATENPGDFAPGKTFTDPNFGAFTVDSVVWTADESHLRGEVWIA